ncbi:MAG TPA: outer membrane beta-barrel protein, partial [Methyloceanibacter sp.]|nr:outer membrane beta-barrel protein [Methyloceanibacter sp.]
TLEDSAGAVDHFFQLSLQKAVWRYLVLGVYGSYERADYAGSQQVDQRTKVGATGEYYFNPITSAYVRYEHTDFFSTPDPSGDFVEDEIKIGIKLRR